MEEKAQAQFDYILIALGVVAVATIVSLYMKSATNTLTQTAQQQTKKP